MYVTYTIQSRRRKGCLGDVSLVAVKELLGHESIEMTSGTGHLSPDVKRDAVKLLDLPGRILCGTLTAHLGHKSRTRALP
jgi:hypothetical protein